MGALRIPHTQMNEFQRWVDELVATRYGTAQRLAHAIGLSHSAFSRGVRSGTLGLDSLLVLARETGEPPGTVLRRAGKGPVADLLQELYGEPAVRPTPAETRVLRAFRALPADAQAAWVTLAETHPGRRRK